jgi:nucleoside 2-deoxyribosyltransferase
MIPVVYIAGPYRAGSSWAIEQNIRQAEAISLKVWQLGAVPICPHTMTRFFQGALPDATWLAGDLELVRRADAVLAVGDWMHSRGSTAEVAFARDRDVPVLESIEDVREWMRKRLTQKDPVTGEGPSYPLPFTGEP